MNTITIQLCAEDRARIDTVIELLGGLKRPDCSNCVEGVASYMAKAAEVMDAQPAVAPASAPVAEVPAPVVPAAPSVTMEQIQKKATQIAAGSADKKAALRAIVNQYATKVSDIPEGAWASVWAQLCKIEGEVSK